MWQTLIAAVRNPNPQFYAQQVWNPAELQPLSAIKSVIKRVTEASAAIARA
jgi:hypothetical protein